MFRGDFANKKRTFRKRLKGLFAGKKRLLWHSLRAGQCACLQFAYSLDLTEQVFAKLLGDSVYVCVCLCVCDGEKEKGRRAVLVGQDLLNGQTDSQRCPL